ETGSIRRQLDAEHLPLAPFAMKNAATIRLRQPIVEIHPATAWRATAKVADHRQRLPRPLRVGPGVAQKAAGRQVHQPRPPAEAVVGVVADEDAVVLIERYVEVIAGAAGEPLEPAAVGPEADHSAAFEADVMAFLRPPPAPLGDVDTPL